MRELAKYLQEEEHQKSLFKNKTKTKDTLELIHSDVCGPMSSTSLNGYEYYDTFIDDYSINTWIYFLNTKSEELEKFKECKSLIENHS